MEVILKNYRYIIIGKSAASISALNKLWQLDPEGSVLCIAREKKKSQLFTTLLHEKVIFRYGSEIQRIHPEDNVLELSDNSSVRYEQLLIATNSSIVLPPIPGIKAKNVFTFHSLQDVQRLISALSVSNFSHVTIIGAGLRGLEAADALRSQNLSITVIEREGNVLPHHIDQEGSHLIERKMKIHNIEFFPNHTVTEIYTSDGKVSGVQAIDFSSYRPSHAIGGTKRTIRTDAIICTTGVSPNTAPAKAAGLQLYRNRIWTNQNLRTSYPNIYAAGDAVAVKDQITGHLISNPTSADAMHQGMIAAYNMAGHSKKYPGMLSMTSSTLFGVKFASCGNFAQSHKGGRFTVMSCSGAQDEHCKMLMKDGIPIGFALIGKTLPQLGMLRRAVMLKQPLQTPPTYQRA